MFGNINPRFIIDKVIQKGDFQEDILPLQINGNKHLKMISEVDGLFSYTFLNHEFTSFHSLSYV